MCDYWSSIRCKPNAICPNGPPADSANWRVCGTKKIADEQTEF